MDIVLQHHFLEKTNAEIDRLNLPAFEPLAKKRRLEHVNESLNSQVGLLISSFCSDKPFKLLNVSICPLMR